MKFATVLTFVAGALAAPAQTEKETRGVVAMAVQHRPMKRSVSNTLQKRKVVKEPVRNMIYQYTANVTIGTPGQTVEVLLDTGSSDLWVYSKKAVGAQRGFDPSKSSSYKYKEGGFEIQYVSGKAKGEWVTDVVELEGAQVKDLQFATVDNVETPGDQPIGIFGIGQVAGEAHGGKQYPNFPQKLVDQKIIGRNAYSMYLDNLQSAKGQVLFGGVDVKKFKGGLKTVPIIADDMVTVNFEIEGIKDRGVLDCGTSLTYLPKDAVQKIVKKFGAEYDSNSMLYYLDNVGNQEAEFKFGDATIKVPASQLVIEAAKFDIPNAPKKYILGVAENDQSNNMNLLGDSLMRSAYIVYDLANKQVAIGQASYNSDSDIQEIKAGKDIPGVGGSNDKNQGKNQQFGIIH